MKALVASELIVRDTMKLNIFNPKLGLSLLLVLIVITLKVSGQQEKKDIDDQPGKKTFKVYEKIEKKGA